MSITVAPRAAKASPSVRTGLRAAAHSDTAIMAGLAVWSLAIAALTWGTWGDLTMDTGYDLVAASRIADGELPYADFTYIYGPLGAFLLGGLFSVTGAGVATAVALGFVLSALAVFLTFRLARLFVDPLPAGLAAAIVAAAAFSGANNSYVLPHTTSAPLAVVLALVALLMLASWALGRSGRLRLPAAGAAAGLVALTRPELALTLYAGTGLWLAVLLARAADRRALLRELAPAVGAAIAAPAIGYGLMLTQVGLGELLWDNLYPRDYIDAAGSVVLEAHAPWTLRSFAELAAHAVPYVAVVGAMLAAGVAIARGGRARTAALALVAVAVLGFLAVLAARPETVRYYLQFAWWWVPAGAWLAVVVLWWRGRTAWTAELRAALLIALVLACVATTTYASFLPVPNAEHPNAVPYVLPIAVVFIAWLHAHVLPQLHASAAAIGAAWLAALALAAGALVVHDARAETESISGPGGTMTALPADAPALAGALDVIAASTQPGDPILLAPQLSALYVMSERTNPLRQLSLLPGMLATAADEDAAIARMDDVQLAIVDRTPQTTYEHGSFGTTFDRRIAAWLQREFRRTAVLRSAPGARTLDIWTRRDR
jgi:hypothetical protein